MQKRSSAYSSLLITSLTLCLVATIVAATGMGYMKIPWQDLLQVIGARLSDNPELRSSVEPSVAYVVIDVRLPRVLCSALVGAGLAISGVVYQGILLNPLADPYTLGISSGAAFGASLALWANISLLGTFSTPLFAFAGAVATLFLVMRLSSFGGLLSAQTLILSGVIVAAILSAGISFIKYLADEQVAVIIFWLMGSFASSTWHNVLLLSLSVFFGLAVTVYYGRDLNILSLGKRSSDSLGVETVRIRIILLVSASFITAVCVSLTGIIGFIGLIIPHLMRYIVGPDNRRLLIVSALSGAMLLLTADTVTRAVLPVELPIGILTALIGGPFFCLIFRQKQRSRIDD
ncbi:MAG: iron ABC transporter permease [Deltaproteobacteria bacterium]|nr:MAG: iron ABC transporter permease [Desulfobacterales bacterium]PIE73810.1 MAG: iron ABC transporter permease [Deltaproteobacteria bacterium]